jgi:hypothetical protein
MKCHRWQKLDGRGVRRQVGLMFMGNRERTKALA